MDILKRMYYWVLGWAEHPASEIFLFLLAFAEASFFPIPPDVLLIALALSKPQKSFRYALITLIGSTLGGLFGYFIGWGLFETVGRYILNIYNGWATYYKLQNWFTEWGFLAVFIAGFTPIPYKIFSIASGSFKLSLLVFSVATVISRGLRFFLVALLLKVFGERAKVFIERNLDWLALVFAGLLIGGFILLKYAK